MANRRLEKILDRDELDWDDPKHREIYLREHVNKGSRAFLDEEEEDSPRSSWPSDDSEDTTSENPQA